MDSRPLTKLLASPITKLTWNQIQRKKPQTPNKNYFHSSSLNSNTFFSKSATVTNRTFAEKNVSTGLSTVCANHFGTSINRSFFNKLPPSDQQQLQVSYAHKAEVEPLYAEGVGWAGQPVVRRTHPILPEVYGDLSDVFTAVEKMTASSKAQEEAWLISQADTVNKIASRNAQLRAAEKPEGKETTQKNTLNEKPSKSLLVSANKTKEETEVKNQSTSGDAIASVKENLKRDPRKHQRSGEVESVFSTPLTIVGNVGIKRNPEEQAIKSKTGLRSKKDKRLKKLKDVHLNSALVLAKQKKKGKKKTKVCTSRDSLLMMTGKKVTKIKKSKKSSFGVDKKRSLQHNILLSLRENAQPVRKSVMISANRQLQTFSPANLAKLALKVKEKTASMIIALSKKQKKSSKLESEGKYAEDCKCPETLEIKTRFPTKICGEAAGIREKKKLKARKGKMCLIENQIKNRRRTFVCNSAKFVKGKRKRQLPKCEKPEKKIAPRVVVCPPVLEEELKKGEKKCVKQVEEVKIRSKTKVCKPIIIHQREVKVAEQKTVCTEKKVKKTISRHTIVCPSTEKNGTSSQKKSKR